MADKPPVCVHNWKLKKLGPVKSWKCSRANVIATNFFFTFLTNTVSGKKGSVLPLSLINAKNCFAHRLKTGVCMDDSIAVLKPLQSKSFQFPEQMLIDYFSSSSSILCSVGIVRNSCDNRNSEILFQLCPRLFLDMASESYGN